MRIARLSVNILGRGAEREFVRVDLAEQHCARGRKARLYRRVRIRHPVRQDVGAGGGPDSRRLHDVLEAIGHAMQRAAPVSGADFRVRRRRLGERAIGGDCDEGFEARVQGGDAIEEGAREARRGNLARADAPAEIDRAQPDQLVIRHVFIRHGLLASRSGCWWRG